MSRDNAEITANEEEAEGPPIRLESISHAPPGNNTTGRAPRDDGGDDSLTQFTSVVSNTYTSLTSFLNRGATNLSTATKKLPSQVQHLAEGGTKMVSELTGGFSDFISHGLPGLGEDKTWKTPSFEYLQSTYGLANADALIATFVCELRQTYGSKHNTFSPDIKVSFPIMISVTRETLCLMVESSGNDYPGKIGRDEILDLTSNADASLRLALTDDRQLVLSGFGDTESKVRAFKWMHQLLTRRTEDTVSSAS